MERKRYRSDEARRVRAERFAGALSDALYALGLTHQSLAATLGVTRYTVDSWTRGDDPSIPSEATFAALCALLDAQRAGLGHTLAHAAERTWEPSATSADTPSISPAPPISSGPFPVPPPLPLLLTSFVGRNDEVAALQGWLARSTGGGRLITLTGAGGIGKTRLALEVAALSRPLFADGVWLLELAALVDEGLVASAVVALFDVRPAGGVAVLDALAAALGERHLLLLLDNCEHLIGACAMLTAHLLARCPRLVILTTSREVLRVPGETTWRLSPLALPEVGAPPEPDRLCDYAAIRLFVERACLSQPDFTLDASNAPLVMQICQRLDGMPLALELAAARLRAMSPGDLAAALDDRFSLLTGGSRVALPRHQTLWATVDWSYSLLSAPEQALLGRLSVFAGGWTTAAAGVVCAGGLVDAAGIGALLADLVDKSLVLVEGAGCYRFLETIREYARSKLDNEGVIERMAAYYVAYVEAHATDYAALDRETPNILAALQAAHERGRADLVLRGANAIHHFMEVRGSNTLAAVHLERAEQAARAAGDHAALVPTLLHLGRVAERSGEYGRAEGYYREGLDLARAGGEAERISALLQNLGAVAIRRGDYTTAEAYLTEGLALARALGDPEQISALLGNLAAAVGYRGDHEQVAVYYIESLALARAMGNIERICALLQGLGVAALNQGDHRKAEAYLRDSLALACTLGHRERLSHLLQHLGVVATECGDYVQAALYLEEGLALARAIHNEERAGQLLKELGTLACKRGDWAAAETALRESLVLARQVGNQRLLCLTLAQWGEWHLAQAEAQAAAALWHESLLLAQHLGNRELEASALYGLARAAAAQGQPALASQQGHVSRALFSALHHRQAGVVESWLMTIETEDSMTA